MFACGLIYVYISHVPFASIKNNMSAVFNYSWETVSLNVTLHGERMMGGPILLFGFYISISLTARESEQNINSAQSRLPKRPHGDLKNNMTALSSHMNDCQLVSVCSDPALPQCILLPVLR